jgi:hypothetical protein
MGDPNIPARAQAAIDFPSPRPQTRHVWFGLRKAREELLACPSARMALI